MSMSLTSNEIHDVEFWLPITGFIGHEVSSNGRVRSIDHETNCRGKIYRVKGKIRKSCKNHRGYSLVQLVSKGKAYPVHRLVASAFVPNPNQLPEVNHKDGDKENNRVDNLEWCTRGENARHAVATGLMNPPKGTDHWRSKLDETQVKTIRKCLNDGMTAYKLARYFKVVDAVIFNIRHGITYKNVI